MKSATRCSAARKVAYAPSMRTKHPGTLTASTREVVTRDSFALRRRVASKMLGPRAFPEQVPLERWWCIRRRPGLGLLQIGRDLCFKTRVFDNGRSRCRDNWLINT